jgi:hypothetical protein
MSVYLLDQALDVGFLAVKVELLAILELYSQGARLCGISR